MGVIRDAFNDAFPDGPAINPTKPMKAEVRAIGDVIEDEVAQITDDVAFALNQTSYFGPVAGPTRQCVNFVATNKQIQSFQSYRTSSAQTSLTLGFPNWQVDADTNFERGTGAPAIITASVEYPLGRFTQVRFSDAASGVIADGSTLLSDAVPVSIPAGAYFRVWSFFQCSAGIIYSNAPGETNVGDSGSEYAPSGIVDKTMTGGTIPADLNCYGPVIILGDASTPSIAIHGDSRAWGTGDSRDGSQNAGNLQRTLAPRFPVVNLARPGDKALSFVAGNSRRREIANYCSHIVVELGINDIRFDDRSAAAVRSDIETIIGLYSDKRVFVSTLEPSTSSTDNWATLANQTTHSTETQRVAYNAAVRSGLTGADGYFDIADVLESSRNSGKWKVTGQANGYTADGLHANRAGYLLVPESGAINLDAIFPAVPKATKFATLEQFQRGKATDLAVSPQVALGEVGNFTPSIAGTTAAGTATYSARGGTYRKIGNLVFFNLSVTWSGHTGTGSVEILGLPFSQFSQIASTQSYTVNVANLTFTGSLVAAGTSIGDGKRIRLFQMSSGGAVSVVPIDADGFIAIQGFYFTGDL